jgi:hypothetical protein
VWRENGLVFKKIMSRRIAAILLLGLLFAAAGCGVKGTPRPPEEPIIKGL